MHPAILQDLARVRQDDFERETRQARLARRIRPEVGSTWSRTHAALVSAALVLLGAVLALI